MAARGSFQKRQKEAARREKRQLKLDRRQGRQPAKPEANSISESPAELQPPLPDSPASPDALTTQPEQPPVSSAEHQTAGHQHQTAGHQT